MLNKNAVSKNLLIMSIMMLIIAAPAMAQDADLTLSFAPLPGDDFEAREGAGSIVDIAIADGRFTTLVAAVGAAGLVETLDGPGPFTVFAPTDDAFAKLPPGTIDALLADTDTLTQILLYHVVGADAKAKKVLGFERLLTVQGSDLKVSLRDGKAFVNNSQIIITDIVADNGIIHVIDSVLLPQDGAEMSGSKVPVYLTLMNNGDDRAKNFLVEVMEGDRVVYRERFNSLKSGGMRQIMFYYTPVAAGESTLKAYVDPYGLEAELSEENNMAERSISISEMKGAYPVISDVNVFYAYTMNNEKYFGVQWKVYNAGTRTARDLDYAVYLTNNGRKVDNGAVAVDMGTIDKLKSGEYWMGSKVVSASSLRSKAKSFFFRAELGSMGMAPAMDDMTMSMEFSKKNMNKNMLDIVETAISAGSFGTLTAAAGAADLVDTLRSNGQFTVFAPTDDAFAKLPSGTVDALLGDIPTLSNILLYHVSAGLFNAGNVLGRDTLHMANNVEASISLEGGLAFIDNAQIIGTDIYTRNGIIHVIDSVIIP